MAKRLSSMGVLLLSMLLLVGAAVPTSAQSPTGKLEQLVRVKGQPFKINPVSAGFLGLGKAEVPVIQRPLTDGAGAWHSANLTARNTIVLMFMPASKKYAIYWRHPVGRDRQNRLRHHRQGRDAERRPQQPPREAIPLRIGILG